ncbi:hypothetical protein CFB3_26040 [Clostridium folliculivorans]|uniref:Uncharacterized protein n=2 Tax=Clostridium TaxID=1485 RepID=A0A6V8SG18_9CLOT|nr:hypothetical protein bsdtw1_01505 [Clostridium fungisolvens]GKU24401.1 hypothetical protein CFOLD11_12270 [Clostridium folliculivorans]GKU30497.1 hypothetical protein CFB3_26040 [Clostridium folliculivorans]
MKNKCVFIISLIIMIISILFMCVNRFVAPLQDLTLRILGSVMLVNIFVLSYSAVKLKSKN